MLIIGENCTQFWLQKFDALSDLATWHFARVHQCFSWNNCSMPTCDGNKVRQVNPFGSQTHSPVLSHHTAKSDTKIRRTDVCDVVVNGNVAT